VKIKTSFSFASIAKFPSKSVVVPLVVPFTITFAPAIGPKSSETIPVIVIGLFVVFIMFLFSFLSV
jgi:hypothetical protein